MDSKIMDLIDAELLKFPPQSEETKPHIQYEQAKRHLSSLFPGHAAYEYICKAIAGKYGI